MGEKISMILFLVPAIVGLIGVVFFGWDPYASAP